ncbi:diguanylate cyclase [Nitrosovibrio sp. Nv17]|uniref:sensor domain-containing diguanylate cyclase n=1 Tax=Nitrosovibrio sp. Nv17 TaxID=1855339 RepID=UPI000909159B|nr:diguanylate cyclase [Nitrosovibrio sp. Nv17]SFW17935.1 diguanylate cyclase (GGDEF) domain-containing protein [Nitrosovibrio sp. Nv17]
MLRLNSIKSKLMVFAIIATLIPSVGLGLLSFWQNEEQISSTITRELRTLTNDASREIALWVEKRAHEVRVSSTSNAVIDGLSAVSRPRALVRPGAHTANPDALAHYLRSVLSRLDTLRELTVVDATGRVVASSAAAAAAVELPQEWPPNSLTEGLVIAPPRWNEHHAAATLSIAMPVLSYDNLLMGALIAVLDLRSLQPHLKSATKSPLGEIFLLDDGGKILIGSQIGAEAQQPLDEPVLRQLQAQPSQSMIFRGMSHRKVIGLADPAENLPITIVAERDHAEIYQAWAGLRNMFLALVGAMLVVVAAVAFQMGRSIVGPLQRLMAAADKIAGGDFEVQLTAARNDELGRLTKVFIQMTNTLRRHHAEIMAANRAMQKQNEMLETLSVTDSLTGLYNRSKLDTILSDEFARYKRTRREFTLLMMDIDHFKTLNDTHGHVAGDGILAAVAGILAQSIRSIDYAARYGGDEFIVVLVETAADQALKTAERIRSQVEKIHYDANGSNLKITVSIGVVQCQPNDLTPTAVLTRADDSLYQAKRAGRNRTFLAAVSNQ